MSTLIKTSFLRKVGLEYRTPMTLENHNRAAIKIAKIPEMSYLEKRKVKIIKS